MNIDQDEITKFDEMATRWWEPTGPCKPLHDLNPLRLHFIQSCCTLKDKAILDVGCGGGILTESLSRFSDQVVGIDLGSQLLEIAREHAQDLPSPPHYECACVEDFALLYPQKFSVITCMELLEHVPDPVSVIKACTHLLKPGGDLFFSTLNRTPKAFAYAIVGAEYLLKLLPRGTHTYEKFIRPSELADWARQCDLTLKHLKGINISIFNQRYRLSDDVSVNYLMHFHKEK